jgi:hypothetical protein
VATLNILRGCNKKFLKRGDGLRESRGTTGLLAERPIQEGHRDGGRLTVCPRDGEIR